MQPSFYCGIDIASAPHLPKVPYLGARVCRAAAIVLTISICGGCQRISAVAWGEHNCRQHTRLHAMQNLLSLEHWRWEKLFRARVKLVVAMMLWTREGRCGCWWSSPMLRKARRWPVCICCFRPVSIRTRSTYLGTVGQRTKKNNNSRPEAICQLVCARSVFFRFNLYWMWF